MKKILFNLAVLIALTEVTHSTQPYAEVDAPQTQAVDVERWMEESGASKLKEDCFYGVERINETLLTYSPERLEAVTKELKDTGLWGMAKNTREINDLMERMRYYPIDLFRTGVAWLKDIGAWDSSDHYERMPFLAAVQKCSVHEDEEILNWIRANFKPEKPRLDGVSSLIKTLKDCPSRCYQTLLGWVVEKGALKKCKTYEDVSKLFLFLESATAKEDFFKFFDFMEETGIWGKCDTRESFESLYDTVQFRRKKHIGVRVNLLKESALWDRCKTGKELDDALEFLRDYNEKLFVSSMVWVKETGFWDAQRSYYGGNRGATSTEICELLSQVRNCTPLQRTILLPWMRDSHIFEKCRHFEDFTTLLKELCEKPDVGRIEPALAWIKDSGIVQSSGDTRPSDLVSAILPINKDRLLASEKWMKESGAWDICAKSGTLAKLLRELENYDLVVNLVTVGNWMKTSGLWERCDGHALPSIMDNLRMCDDSLLQKVESWLKKLDIWETSSPSDLSKRIRRIHLKGNHDWIKSLEGLMEQYEVWSSISCASHIRTFIIGSL